MENDVNEMAYLRAKCFAPDIAAIGNERDCYKSGYIQGAKDRDEQIIDRLKSTLGTWNSECKDYEGRIDINWIIKEVFGDNGNN